MWRGTTCTHRLQKAYILGRSILHLTHLGDSCIARGQYFMRPKYMCAQDICVQALPDMGVSLWWKSKSLNTWVCVSKKVSNPYGTDSTTPESWSASSPQSAKFCFIWLNLKVQQSSYVTLHVDTIHVGLQYRS